MVPHPRTEHLATVSTIPGASYGSKEETGESSPFLEDWIGTGHRRKNLCGPARIRTDRGPWVQATHGRGTTTESDTKNRNGFLSDNRKHLGITTGRPALSDKSLGPYRCSSSSIPSVLRLNSPAGCDGAPARES